LRNSQKKSKNLIIVTSHQAFLMKEALSNIAEVTLQNIKAFVSGEGLPNEICYRCTKIDHCDKNEKSRCF